MTDAYTKSTIYMRNDLETSSLSVTPVLYLSNGVKITAPAVTLAQNGTAVVSINDVLAKQGISSSATLSGYVELQYQWPWDPLCATVSSVDETRSVIFTYGLSSMAQPSQKYRAGRTPVNPVAGPQVLEGTWWKQEPGVTGFVALSNTTDRPLSATVQVSDSSARPLGSYEVTISPHGTKRVELQELNSGANSTGGIEVTYYGGPDAIIVNGSLEDLTKGYSAGIPFGVSPSLSERTETLSYAELGLMTGAADPMMHFPAGTVFIPYSVVRNLGSQPATIIPVIYWMEGGVARSARQNAFVLAPLQTQNLDVASFMALAGLTNFNGVVNLVFEVQAPQDSVLLGSGSVDQSYTYVFEVVPRAAKVSGSKNLAYWSTENEDDTMVTLWNPADEPQDFIFRFFFTGGHYSMPVHLEARATSTFNVSEVIKAQSPDSEGNVIPLATHKGSAQVSGPEAENQLILVSMDAATYNVRKATCTYRCVNCNGGVSWVVQPGTFGTSIGSSTQLSLTDTWNNGAQHNLTSLSTWSSSAAGVAIVGSGVVEGVAPGGVTIYAEDANDPWAGQVCGAPPPACPPDQGGGGNSVGTVYDATPVITGINPSDWNSGASTQVTFTGQYFGTNAPILGFSPGSGISYGLSSYNDTQIVASVTVAAGTPNEQVSVTVTNNGYSGQSFNGGSVGQPATSGSVFATVHAPINSPEITVIAWVDQTASDLNPLPSGANQNLVTHLNGAINTCAADLFAWSVMGARADLMTSTDEDYANRWLIKYSANQAPPATITPSNQRTAGNYRLYNDYGGSGAGGVDIGITPDPCGANVPATILVWIAPGQPSQYQGASSTSSSGKVYQLAEGRAGTMAQKGFYTINGRATGTMPWIWSVIEFDSAGNPTYSDVGMFPTYSVYVNGVLKMTYQQSAVEQFFAKDQTYQRTPSQVQ